MAVFFLDSSALVKRYLSETGSVWVESLFDAAAGHTIFIAAVTGVEPVWGIVEWRALGLSDAEIFKHHPDLTHADLEAAWDYHREHPEEIEQAIRENEEA